jgi:invasion protein IalB
MFKLVRALMFGAVFFWPSPQLYAQTKPADSSAAGKPVGAEPQSTSATFGDWVMRCNRMEVAEQTQRVCEVAQTIIIQGQQAPVAELAIGRIKKADPLRVTVVLPVNVAFPSAPQVYSDATSTDALELAWKRCLPRGCFADAIPKEEIFRRWRAAKTTGRIETKDAFGRNVVVTISFRGLAQALDALNKEP